MPASLFPSPLHGPLFSTAAMRALFEPRATIQRMLDVETALARAEASVGVIPTMAADAIAAACVAERFDAAAIAEAATGGGNLAIPLVKALTEEVRKQNADAAGYVHWGATSQDIIDTALVLQLRDAGRLLIDDATRAAAGFAKLANAHRSTMLAGRTLMQQALPIPFGLKAAGYAAALARSSKRLRRATDEACILQFGGAAGTLAALKSDGMAVAEKLAAELSLALPDAPWHTHRDRLAELAAAVGILVGSCGKVARDVSLLMQTEVAEAFEPAGSGRGGSSTMPQKRNPVGAAIALTAANLAPQLVASVLSGMAQEHERALGGWHAEWLALPSLFLLASGAIASIVEIAEGLEVDVERMRENLDGTNGAIMAESVMMTLALKLGRGTAHTVLERATKNATSEKKLLQHVLAGDPEIMAKITRGELARAFDPAAYQGAAQTFIDRLLASARSKNTGETS
jgi:3-carboxy-cis,cis-muconate cycloisomerase